ncbi:MAG: S8 family serine peptidase [Betaproteobacteria bacterium]
MTLGKVDLSAADNVTTSTAGYNPFRGTSAAAPHAAAIAALAWSANPAASAMTIKDALLASAPDIEASGRDRDSGYGIVMAPASIRAVLSPISVTKSFSPPRIQPGGTSTLTIALINPNAVALQNVAFTNTYSPQVTNAANPNAGGSGAGCGGIVTAVPGGGSLSLSGGTVPAGITCTVMVKVTSSTPGVYVDGSGDITTPIALNTPGALAALTVVSVTVSPASLPGGTFNTAYNETLTASGGVSAYNFAITAGSPPNGLTLAPGGALIGTPTVAGPFNFTVTATDSTSAGLGGPFSGSQAYSVTIAKTNQTIMFNGISERVYGAAAFTVSATATSGLAVTFSSLTPAVCTISGNLVTIVAVGPCTVRASQTGNGNYNAALNVDQGFAVTAPNISVFPAALPDSALTLAYTQTITAAGGTAPY